MDFTFFDVPLNLDLRLKHKIKVKCMCNLSQERLNNVNATICIKIT